MTPQIIKVGSPRHRQKLMMLDFDWTIVKPSSNGTFPRNEDDWTFLHDDVVDIVQEHYRNGYAIIIFTNQTKPWKIHQIQKVMDALGVPCTAVVAFDKQDKKPSRTMFDLYIRAKKWKLEESFYVGDALGRKNDFADSDKAFAEAIGVPVFAPEDIFGIHKTNVATTPIKTNSSQEMVVMVGYPGSGKSTIADQVFGANGYTVLHSDDIKNNTRMLRLANTALTLGDSVVIDATNPSRQKRKEYIDLATSLQIPSRCVYISTSMEESMARNSKREEKKQVPKIAYFMFRKHFEEPSKEEGFVDVQKI